jgi:hypothetical protein
VPDSVWCESGPPVGFVGKPLGILLGRVMCLQSQPFVCCEVYLKYSRGSFAGICLKMRGLL